MMDPYWETPEYRKAYTAAQREQGVKEGWAMPPDGAYPIKDAADLTNAIKLVGNGSASKADVKAWIVKRANALKLTKMLPDSWTANRSRRKASNRNREVRSLDRNVELRDGTDDDGRPTLRGMVIKYGVPYTVRDSYGEFSETIERGAAATVISANPDVRFLFNHDGMPLARTTNGSLTLRDLPDGVEVEARLDPDMPSAQDVIGAVRNGLLTQMSVGMVVGSDTWNDQMDRRTISRLSAMPDVSAVTYPASDTTSIEAVRSALETNPQLRAQIAGDVLPSARLDKIEAEVRAGKTLSNATATVLVGMAKQVHDLLASGGADFSHSAPSDVDSTADDTEPDSEGVSVVSMEDGTEDDSSEMEPMTRSDDVDVELRQMMLDQLMAEQDLAELTIR